MDLGGILIRNQESKSDTADLMLGQLASFLGLTYDTNDPPGPKFKLTACGIHVCCSFL